MKKKLFVICLALSMLTMVTGNVLAAPSAGSALTLLSATAGMNGTVFLFKVSGEFSGAHLKGSAHVQGGEDYGLDCRQLDDETVRCTASRNAQGNVTVMFGGSTFWTYVAPFTRPTTYCYNVFDWALNFTYWQHIGDYCQDVPAQYGDVIEDYHNMYWNEDYDFEFLPNSPETWVHCGVSMPPQSGDAYYYPDC
ncbi:MAG: hypothetical protein IPM31_01740 [Anaerolineae bacterium]|nr:hypothetical protein [Anaerolineae bacterium]MBL8105377.1 hypothetical protein [Anaerolineales bacterium]MCC7190878.1 hypothetical protein [Anaerolineales bacterium]